MGKRRCQHLHRAGASSPSQTNNDEARDLRQGLISNVVSVSLRRSEQRQRHKRPDRTPVSVTGLDHAHLPVPALQYGPPLPFPFAHRHLEKRGRFHPSQSSHGKIGHPCLITQLSIGSRRAPNGSSHTRRGRHPNRCPGTLVEESGASDIGDSPSKAKSSCPPP
ncbi:hypothetical protein FSOLCH5_011919 [Fusarium solani]